VPDPESEEDTSKLLLDTDEINPDEEFNEVAEPN
jgi:hypothetical protein